MQWDLGLQGIGLLLLMSLSFGAVAELLLRHVVGRWVWLPASAAYFVGGLLTSEVWFGWATEEELQPNVDGLSFDEVLMLWLPGMLLLLVVRYLADRNRRGLSL